MTNPDIQGADCTKEFKAAYENRYTWDPNFLGYKGKCSWTDGTKTQEGTFSIGADLKANVENITDNNIHKSISSQLWEVAVHRIRRSFKDTHGQNSFKWGDINDIGCEVIVEGKNKGDKYRIKNDIVRMVHRHIHGKLIIIYTEEVISTENGYLSKKYSSEYLDPTTCKSLQGKSYFTDSFEPLFKGGPWVLTERCIQQDLSHTKSDSNKQVFNFFNLHENTKNKKQ